MHIQLDKKPFLKALNKVQGVVERKHTLPILANVKITASDSGLQLYTTDTDIAIMSFVSCNIISEGVVTAPAHLLCDIVKRMPDDALIDISKIAGSDSILIKTQTSEFTLPALPADTFPDFEVTGGTSSVTLDALQLRMMLSTVKHAMSMEEIRYYLNGIYLYIDHALDPASVESREVNNDIGITEANDERIDGTEFVPEVQLKQNLQGAEYKRLTAVATDSHRMAVITVGIINLTGDLGGIIIPRKTVYELLNVIEDIEGEVHLEFHQKKITLSTPNTKLISKLIDGKFPEYKKAIPPQSNISAIVSAQALSKAIDLVTTIATDKTKSVKLQFTGDMLRVFVNSQSNSYAVQEIDKIKYNGEESIEIAFNSRYLLDILSTINSSEVELFLTSVNQAVLIRIPVASQEASKAHKKKVLNEHSHTTEFRSEEKSNLKNEKNDGFDSDIFFILMPMQLTNVQ